MIERQINRQVNKQTKAQTDRSIKIFSKKCDLIKLQTMKFESSIFAH